MNRAVTLMLVLTACSIDSTLELPPNAVPTDAGGDRMRADVPPETVDAGGALDANTDSDAVVLDVLDSGAVDVPTDVAPDVTTDALVDVVMDSSGDVAVDSSSDVAVDTPSDTSPDTGFDAGPDVPGFDGGSCAAAGAQRCEADKLLECALGSWVLAEACVLGCTSTAGSARCRTVDVTHVTADALLFAGTGDLSVPVGETWTANTSTGEISTEGGTVIRAPGAAGDASGILFRIQPQGGTLPDLAIFAARRLVVEGTLFGVGSRSLVLLSREAAVVSGQIDVGGLLDVAGPGGSSGGTDLAPRVGPGGGGAGSETLLRASAGGGGGHSGVGGTGGADNILGGGAGGAQLMDPMGSPLRGGGGGGAGARDDSGGPGGGGGGALQITSNVSITVSGVIRAPGEGGVSGRRSGGGGGAGGTVFLEAPLVVSSGAIVCNGGGGGGANTSLGGGSGRAQRGQDSVLRATGSAGSGLGAGGGGVGGAGAAIDGESGGGGLGGGGGGGGAVGRIHINSVSVGAPGGLVSPSSVTVGPIVSR